MRVKNSDLLEEPLLVLLALVAAVYDLQEEAGQSDQLGVGSRKEALQEAVTGLVEQNEDGERVLHLEMNSEPQLIDTFQNFSQGDSCAIQI